MRVTHDLIQQFGGSAALQARVSAFRQALFDHRLTVDVPAPVEADVVEQIARADGVVEEIPVTPPPPVGLQPPLIGTYDFLQRWTSAERNLLRRRVLQADAVGDALGDALDMAKTRTFLDVSSGSTTQFVNACVNNGVLTAPRRAQIMDLAQTSP